MKLLLQKPLYPEKPYIRRQFPYYHGAISQDFGENNLPIYKEMGMLGHNGIDIPHPPGYPIKAAHDGICIEAITRANKWGLGCKIATERRFDYDVGQAYFWTVYWHAQRVLVSKGQKVKAGQVIMRGNSTGYSTANHLHFGLMPCRRSQTGWYSPLNKLNGYNGYIDPKPYIKETMFELRIDKNKDQYICNLQTKEAFAIPDVATLHLMIRLLQIAPSPKKGIKGFKAVQTLPSVDSEAILRTIYRMNETIKDILNL